MVSADEGRLWLCFRRLCPCECSQRSTFPVLTVSFLGRLFEDLVMIRNVVKICRLGFVHNNRAGLPQVGYHTRWDVWTFDDG